MSLDKNFLWGNSVSSMQSEGAWNEQGKGKSVYDVKVATENTSDWKVGIDEFHRYKEDVQLMKEMGVNCYRFQISWTRIFPNGDGTINEKGFEYYDHLIEELIEAGIEPMICLYHFDMPLHLAEKYNGFISRYVVNCFVDFARVVIDRYSKLVKYWISFNEQNGYLFEAGFENSGFIHGDKTLEALYTIANNTMVAHSLIANYIHDRYPKIKIGGMLAYQEFYPATNHPEDILIARKASEFINQHFVNAFSQGRYSNEVLHYLKEKSLISTIQSGDLELIASHKNDFISFSYYYTVTLDHYKLPKDTPPSYYMRDGSIKNSYLETSEWGWQIDPLGFRSVLTKLSNETNLPVFPIENGIGVREQLNDQKTIQDDYRISYHKNHLKALYDAVKIDGANVMGYLGWGLIDIPSSKGDMNKRYGVIYVNRDNHDLKDLKRIPKASFYWLKQVIATNGEHLD
ncbi:glycoside hydrolase family 1 protein [Dellaglioa algida]|uniref:Glycosyl hydrolase 1 family protein n=1 Tax=Dellaglioa algida DSM 15638 TaxID=1423719 RepID=A0A0R1HLA7_9LACO|nr:glycoside hydrolase family 1 protein [Dellaglioa algida]KRK45171.1 glycosyl hydrolase 1 family protein [Dellaglioa algida DSM 15638]MDK1727889.1 glycoside hydrolase family 1 protein [Dellaglioa algida]MDK1733367.1 glycoside hydrolase family 1 protein [Dellaglioa algida]MDK1734854.1 glycoside hydrolase family 1 protein [Dellaglioa algida]MDK1736485.1 glycoside hydrolase family 1 protein [Dellaglioa algida]